MKKLFLLIVILILSGCVISQDEFYALQREVATLKKDFRDNAALFSTEAGEIKSSTKRLDELHTNLRKSFAETNAHIEELELSINKMKGEKEELEKQTNALAQNVSEAIKLQNESLRNLKAEMKKLSDEVASIKNAQAALFSNISTVYVLAKSSKYSDTTKEDEKDKKSLYNEALELYKKSEYDKAIEKFNLYVNRYVYDSLTPNALYWTGECYYSQKKFDIALQYFHRVVTDFPNSNKVASALLKESFTLKELGMEKEAKAALEELLYRFPYSEEAAEAKKQRDRKK